MAENVRQWCYICNLFFDEASGQWFQSAELIARIDAGRFQPKAVVCPTCVFPEVRGWTNAGRGWDPGRTAANKRP